MLALFTTFAVSAQSRAKKVSYDKANQFVYNIYDYDSDHIDTNTLTLVRVGNTVVIDKPMPEGEVIPGWAHEITRIDYDSNIVSFELWYPDEAYRAMGRMGNARIKWDTTEINKNRVKYTCSINSNKLEFVVDKAEKPVSPMPYYGRFEGVLVEFWNNGKLNYELASCTKTKVEVAPVDESKFINVSGRDFDRIQKEHLTITTHVFDDVQLNWGQPKPVVKGNVPADTILHFNGGTLALKRVSLPQLPAHYQTFVEVHQKSFGDAYDRTGTVFVIPHNGDDPNFFQGMINQLEAIPSYIGRNGVKYLGLTQDGKYQPPVELMRFFTSFGVGHFNDGLQIDGLEWEDENYFKQEVTDLSEYLQGDVWIAICIGNYDAGGHKVTMDIKSYPGDTKWDLNEGKSKFKAQSLFNTCNVLSSAAQNENRLFATDSLRVRFYIPDSASQVILRYITTGHGGWGGGDEFNPKVNYILIDGEEAFSYTPWRGDCARYREWNPVSGNFWNGISSCDLSRSGWCPGTATQPTYFDMTYLEPGWHTMTVAIDQGKPMGGSQSAWNVSGVLLIK